MSKETKIHLLFNMNNDAYIIPYTPIWQYNIQKILLFKNFKTNNHSMLAAQFL